METESAALERGEWQRVSGKRRKTTLGKHGRRTVVAGRPLDFEPLGLPFRRRMGEMVDSRSDLDGHFGMRLALYVAHALTSLDGQKMPEGEAEKLTLIRTLSVADVMGFGYLRLAHEDEGRFRINGGDPCPKCKGKLPKKMLVDLFDLPMVVFDEEPRVRYRLVRDWKFRDLKVETITVGYPTVATGFLKLTDEMFNRTSRRSMEWIAGSIVEINDTPMSLTLDELCSVSEGGRPLSDIDFEGLDEAVDENIGGPAHAIRYDCPKCKSDLALRLNWPTGFFGRSGG